MRRSPLAWGAGLTIVLQSLPALIIPPVLAASLPTLLARFLLSKSQSQPPSSSVALIQTFLDLPTFIRALISLALFTLGRQLINDERRRRDRVRLGPDVIEAPRMRMRWPWNLDFIPFVLNSREVGESIFGFLGCECMWWILMIGYDTGCG